MYCISYNHIICFEHLCKKWTVLNAYFKVDISLWLYIEVSYILYGNHLFNYEKRVYDIELIYCALYQLLVALVSLLFVIWEAYAKTVKSDMQILWFIHNEFKKNSKYVDFVRNLLDFEFFLRCAYLFQSMLIHLHV